MNKITNCLFSIIMMLSRANDDIVVSEPQNPMAMKKEYFASKLKYMDNIEKIPRTKLPTRFTIKTFDPKIPNNKGNEVILYLKKAPNIAPRARKANSIPFIQIFIKNTILYWFIDFLYTNII